MSESIEVNRLKELLLGDKTAEGEGQVGLLKKRGLTVEEFARLSKLTRSSLYYYLGDKKRPSRETIMRMAQVLEIETSELLQYIAPREAGRPPARTF